jgi:hypothetical protein
VRLRSSLAVGLVMATVTLAALAQTRGRGAAPRPKPAKVDAGTAEGPSADDAGTAPAATSPTTTAPGAGVTDGGAPSQAQLVPSYYDGGQKPSPLNPAPAEFASQPAAPASGALDYDKLLGDISTLRARVAAVGDSLFRSRIAIAVQTEGAHAKIARFTVSLDDGVVYTAQPSFRPEDMTLVYEHAVAPGRHAVTIDVERRDAHDEAFSTTQRSRMVVDVPKDHRLSVEARIIDDSTMGEDFPGDRSGKYDLRVRAKVTAKPVGK